MLKSKNILKYIAVLTVMIISIGLLTGCKGKQNKVEPYEEPVKNLVEGLGEANSEKFLNAFPTFIAEYMDGVFSDEYLKEILQEAEKDYGENISLSYKLTKKTEISQEDINSMQEGIKTNFNEEITITNAYKLDVEVTTKGDKNEDVDEDSFNVYEIDGKWYILDI